MTQKDTEFRINGLRIDPKIFTFKFNCKCTGECCLYGVFTDLKEAEEIIRIKDRLVKLFDETQEKDYRKWFEPPEKDEDFESGVAVGTQVINHKCTFLDKDGLCTLQKLAMQEGEHMWKYKPMYCILFPFTIFEGALTIDDEHIDRLKTCNNNPVPQTTIYEACRAELKHFFGEEDFLRLEEYRKEYLSTLKRKEVA
jgi:Fe-S-cluster containining protein